MIYSSSPEFSFEVLTSTPDHPKYKKNIEIYKKKKKRKKRGTKSLKEKRQNHSSARAFGRGGEYREDRK